MQREEKGDIYVETHRPFLSVTEATEFFHQAMQPLLVELEDQNRRSNDLCVEIDPELSASDSVLRGLGANFVKRAEIARIMKSITQDERLAWDHPETACNARAHWVAEFLRQRGVATAKLFIHANSGIFIEGDALLPTVAISDRKRALRWGHHVAALCFERPRAGPTKGWVVDPTFSPDPLSVSDWGAKFIHRRNHHVRVILAGPEVYDSGSTAKPGRHAHALAEASAVLAGIRRRCSRPIEARDG